MSHQPRKLDVAAIRARAEAATAGPWDVLVQDVRGGHPWIEVLAARRLVCEAATTMDQELTPADRVNFAFIAAARADVPALCARVVELEGAMRLIADAKSPDMAVATCAAIARAALDGGEP